MGLETAPTRATGDTRDSGSPIAAVGLLVSAGLVFVMPLLGIIGAGVTALVWRRQRGVIVVAALICLGALGMYVVTGRLI